jgi:hypothetical protein
MALQQSLKDKLQMLNTPDLADAAMHVHSVPWTSDAEQPQNLVFRRLCFIP